MSKRYQQSESILEKALEVIPLGSQTFSKSYTQFPYGVSPYFLDRGKGAYVWDVDGNKYLDCVNGLLAVSLGYCDPDVDEAVKKQLDKGVSFSLATTLEERLARKLVDIIPSAEMVRFGKNGTDATSGAVRVARAVTGKEHIIVCGYHGWQDWYIGSTTKDLGVPSCTKELTHHFEYNNLDSLTALFEQYKDQVAAVVMEPANITYPAPGFLETVKEIAHTNGALLIFDETITGFRFALGGAQELFGVTPDLSTFGKGMGNGYPISALVGKKEYMEVMEKVFLSSTFGGEALSLAAASAVLDKLISSNGIAHYKHTGKEIIEGVNNLISQYNFESVFSVSGHPSWTFVTISDCNGYTLWEIKSLWMQECLKQGLLTFGTHNISVAFGSEEVAFLLEQYEKVFKVLHSAVFDKRLYDCLECKPIQSLFKVR